MKENESGPGGAVLVNFLLFKNLPYGCTRRLFNQMGDALGAGNVGADQSPALDGKPGVKVLSIP
ncbi:ABC transporter substrate-binding protein, partial [Enterobacter sichuanensis]